MATFEPGVDRPLLLVASTPMEVRGLIRIEAAQTTGAWPVVEVSPSLTVVVSGVGRANAAAATAYALSRRFHPYVVNVGIAGALPGGGLEIGDVVVATESVFFEEGIDLPEGPCGMESLGFELGASPWAEWNRLLIEESTVQSLLARLPAPVRRGQVATVARCSGTDRWALSVVRQTGALAEAMEGAAVVLAARRMGAVAAEVRVISNTCGHRSRQRWDLALALERLSAVIDAMTGHTGR